MGKFVDRTSYVLNVTFTEPLLGSLPGKDTPASDFLTARAIEKNPELSVEDEAETIPEAIKKGTTVFHRDPDGNPIIYNYVVKGVLKDAAGTLNGMKMGDLKVSNFRSHVDTTVIVAPRRIRIFTDKPIGFFERPLKAMTQQGPRVTLARSERIEPGAYFECDITCLETSKFHLTEEMLRELLDYSRDVKGFGQWHNSGIYGKFDYTLQKV